MSEQDDSIRAVRAVSIGLFLFLVYSPLLALAWGLGAMDHSESLSLLVPTGRRAALLARSGLYALAVSALTVTLSIPAALFLWLRRGLMTKLLLSLLIVAVPVPAYFHFYGWGPLFSRLISVTGPGREVSQLASIWVQAAALLPAGVLLALLGLRSVDQGLIEAASCAQAPRTVWWRVVTPLCRPVIAATAGLLAVLAATDFTIPYLFSVSTYSLEIFTEFSADPQPAQTLLLSVPLLLLCGAVLLASQGGLYRLAAGTRRGPYARDAHPLAGLLPMSQYAGAIVAMAPGVLLAMGLIEAARPDGSMLAPVWDARREFLASLQVSAGAALIACALAFPVARTIVRGGKLARLLWITAVLPLAMPAPLVGTGLIALWNHSWTTPFYDSPGILLLALVVRFLPLAVLLQVAFVSRVDTLPLDAGRIFAPGLRHRFQVDLPAFAPALAAAAGLVFTLSFSEIGVSLLLAPPGHATLAMRIYNYLHYGASDVVATLCAAQVLVVVAAGGLVLHRIQRSGGAP